MHYLRGKQQTAVGYDVCKSGSAEAKELGGCDESWDVIMRQCANVESHPRWSQISVLDVASDGQLAELLWIDPKIWDMEQPTFTRVLPCQVAIPPWTKTTGIVEYPRVTVTEGTWSTTITRSPLIVTQLNFEVVTLTAASGGKNKKRNAQAFGDFWPVPAKTPGWPAVTYTIPDGNEVAVTTTIETKSTGSPLEEGRPMDNLRSCYDGGQKATNAQLANTARRSQSAAGRAPRAP